MKEFNLLGIGSPWQWDRLAWMVLDAIQYRPDFNRLPLSITLLDRPNLQLFPHLQASKINLILDAILLDAPFGEMIHSKVDKTFIETLQTRLIQPYSTHGIALAQTLALGEILGKLPPELYFIGFNILNSENCHKPLVYLRKLRLAIFNFIFSQPNILPE